MKLRDFEAVVTSGPCLWLEVHIVRLAAGHVLHAPLSTEGSLSGSCREAWALTQWLAVDIEQEEQFSEGEEHEMQTRPNSFNQNIILELKQDIAPR